VHSRIISTTSGETFTRASTVPAMLRRRYSCRWKPFDSSRNWPDLGERFIQGERAARKALREAALNATREAASGSFSMETETHVERREIDYDDDSLWEDRIVDDKPDLDWAAVLKRTFESYIRGERPNMYGEWLVW
jgi:DDB1- and CUL4-associated factor 13